MRFLADENFPGSAVDGLLAAGQDVIWVRTVAPGMPDHQVLDWAVREERILLTFDKDFGELARGSSLPPSCGVILLRTPTPKPSDAGRQIANLILVRDDWAGCFSVIEPGRVRMRPFAPP
jgi:predicted nuclease of predicted toxin-antitoxin system